MVPDKSQSNFLTKDKICQGKKITPAGEKVVIRLLVTDEHGNVLSVMDRVVVDTDSDETCSATIHLWSRLVKTLLNT